MTEKSNLFHRQQSDHDHKTNDHHDDNQDDDDQEADEMRGSGVGGCRWNPTKEQIEMLESIYNNEGVRTPTAHQIQQITARLRVYGHIEGKNVFYWFQNHKARQRQKQRQERFNNLNINLNYHPNNINNNNNHMNRFITPFNNHFHTLPHNHGITGVNHPMFHHNYSHNLLPNPNVICGPYYNVQQTSNNNDIGYHPLHSPHFTHSAPAIDHHALMRRSSSPSTKHMMQLPRGAVVPHGSTLTGYCAAMMTGQYDRGDTVSCMGTRTLDLFPVHPTGILENKFDVISANNSATNSSAGSPSSESDASGDQRHQMFFDFFSTDHVLSENQ